MNPVIMIVEDILTRNLASVAMREQQSPFHARASELMRGVLPALDWLEWQYCYPLELGTIECAFGLPWIRSFTLWGGMLIRDRSSGRLSLFGCAHDVPAPISARLRHYLQDLPGGFSLDDDVEQCAQQHHGFATMYFRPGFAELRHRGARWLQAAASGRPGGIQSGRES